MKDKGEEDDDVARFIDNVVFLLKERRCSLWRSISLLLVLFITFVVGVFISLSSLRSSGLSVVPSSSSVSRKRERREEDG